MAYSINYSRQAKRELERIPGNIRKVIFAKINAYASDPVSLTNSVIRLSNAEEFRMRVGDYRIIFYLTTETMEIVKIGHRGSVYQ